MDYSKIYNINFRLLANLLTPIFLRNTRFINWLTVLFKPLEEINLNFLAFRNESVYKLEHSGQVVFLQKVLNDKFDEVNRDIYIEDAPELEALFLYAENDEKPIYINETAANSPVYIDSENDVSDLGGTDFIVFAPASLSTKETQIKGIINYYKLASKKYVIQWI